MVSPGTAHSNVAELCKPCTEEMHRVGRAVSLSGQGICHLPCEQEFVSKASQTDLLAPTPIQWLGMPPCCLPFTKCFLVPHAGQGKTQQWSL